MGDDRVFVLCMWSDELACWTVLVVSKHLEELRDLSFRLSVFAHVWCRVISVVSDDEDLIEAAVVGLKPPDVEARFSVRRGVAPGV